MKGRLKLACILLWLFCLPAFTYAQKAFDYVDGIRLKFKVKENGIYRITYDDIKKAGVNPDDLNPAKIVLVSAPIGMLPQSNSVEFDGHRLINIKITGAEDGKFNKGDEIIFYGQGPDKLQYNASKKLFAFENNIYSDENYYTLRLSDQLDGWFIAKSDLTAGSRPVVNQYLDFSYYENDQYNDQKSGRDWFGEQFEVKLDATIRFDLPGIVPNSDIRVVSNLMTQSYQYSYFKILWNGTQFLDRRMDTIPQSTYSSKGKYGIDTLTLNANTYGANSTINQDVKFVFTKGGGNRSVGYLNYFQFTVARKASMYTNPTIMYIPPQPQAESDIEVTSVKDGTMVWDITDPMNPVEVPMLVTGSTGKFAAATNTTRAFVIFDNDGIKKPEFVTNIKDKEIDTREFASLLIVTHENFLAEAERLAAHRRSAYGITVQVVTTRQIYDKFSGGRQDVTAIRNYVRDVYNYSGKGVRNLLLFGRGSYDYKDRVFNNTNFVPIYQSRNSMDPMLTYSSDDYYGFLEMNEGVWLEDPEIDHTLDIGVGRLPVTTADEARAVVDKLIAYDKKQDQSFWKQRILFVADDGDLNIHNSQADQLAETLETLYKTHSGKLYLDAFEQQTMAAGQISPKAKEALQSELNRGYDIVNYTGHGSERVWMQERILDQNTPDEIRNKGRLPLFVTATCEFGRHDNPLLKSTAELMLLKKDGGAIGLVTTARPTFTQTNFVLNKVFYQAYFEKTTEVKDLGSIFMKTKNLGLAGVTNRNFSLLGDPSMRFGPPVEEAVVTSVATADGSDVLKALSKVMITGEIRANSKISSTFNGTIDIELFDKRSDLVTKGDENIPFKYKDWDHSLFRGKGTVVNGEFAFEFILPEGISDQIQNGKIVLYASSANKSRTAAGALTNIKVGGREVNPVADVSGPSIELFMGDTTFINGGYANSDTYLVGKLFDRSGMNISGYRNGTMTAVLDGAISFDVTDYYAADEDNFTSGTFSYPISNLEEGQHTISFTAADTYGNVGTAAVTFIVGEDGALVIEELLAWPNPFSQAEPAAIEFKHNRAGEDLEVQVAIYDVLGQVADHRQFVVNSSTYKVTLFNWDGITPGGAKMGNGIYLVKLRIRSVSDGAKNDKIARLILTN